MFRVRLAPMCGITDHIFRSLCGEQGCDIAYTEMISAQGYLCAPNQRATVSLMKRDPEEKRLIVQLFGREPDVVAEAAARMEELGCFEGIDINMGCPAKKIAPSGEGCGLMRTPETAFRMMKKTVESVRLPVSVKMRLGYDDEHINVFEYAQMAEEAGIAEITIHGRTRQQQYAGEADWEMISEVKRRTSIPVIGNGDLFTAQKAAEALRTYQTDGIMIGRGAMGNPWIFRDIKTILNGNTPVPVPLKEKEDMIFRHYRSMLKENPEHIAVREMRKHIGWYIRGLRNAGKFRNTINRCESSAQALEMIHQFFLSAEPEAEGAEE